MVLCQIYYSFSSIFRKHKNNATYFFMFSFCARSLAILSCIAFFFLLSTFWRACSSAFCSIWQYTHSSQTLTLGNVDFHSFTNFYLKICGKFLQIETCVTLSGCSPFFCKTWGRPSMHRVLLPFAADFHEIFLIESQGHSYSQDVIVMYRSGTVNSKSFVGKVSLRIKWKFKLN